MAKSIMQTKDECYICHRKDNLDTHHICNGPLRNKSEHWGGTVKLCRFHHTTGGKHSVHGNPQMAKELKMQFQATFELLYGHDRWMEEFKKNYL